MTGHQCTHRRHEDKESGGPLPDGPVAAEPVSGPMTLCTKNKTKRVLLRTSEGQGQGPQVTAQASSDPSGQLTVECTRSVTTVAPRSGTLPGLPPAIRRACV